jgi:hypothetical protein
MASIRHLTRVSWLILWPVACLDCADASPLPPPPEAIIPFRSVAAFASAHNIPMEGFDLSNADGPGREGDTVTALIALREGKLSRQWLTHFQVSKPTDKERASTTKEVFEMTTNGRVHRFSASADLPLEIRTAGPFTVIGKSQPADQRARTRISPDYLSLGFDRHCRLVLQFASHPQKENATPPVLSEQDERVVVGVMPALLAFFKAVENTPGLREVLWAITDKPSAWSVVKRGGKIEPGIDLGMQSYEEIKSYPGWSAPGLPIYRLSPVISLNGQPALVCSLFVTSPRPPLLITAGIIGLVAERPDRDDRHLDIRILATRRAPAQPAPKTD